MDYLFYTWRVPEELMIKLRLLAEKDKRSVNKELEYIVEQYIYENLSKCGDNKENDLCIK